MAAKKTAPNLPPLSFRAFLEDASFCGLTLSPHVAAIADASEGYPVDLTHDECMAAFGCPPGKLPQAARRTVCVSAGGRGGKSSRLLAPKALHAAWTVALPDLRTGERGRSVLIAPDKDLAEQDLDYVRGYAEDSPVLRPFLVPSPRTVVRLRRLDGTQVDIRVGAATRGGKAARARSLVFLGLDEAAFFFSDDGRAVTDREIYRAGIQRVVPGGQVWIVTTPWIEEVGILESKLKDETDSVTGLRKHERALVVARVSTHALNPNWDREPGREGEIERDMRSDDPENAAREIDAIPLAAGTSCFFDPAAVARCFDLGPFTGARIGVGAGFDGGFSSDCLAAALAGKHRGADGTPECFDWFDALERRPKRGEPLKPSVVIGDVATFVKAGGSKQLVADGHYKESVREHLDANGVQFIAAPEGGEGKVSTYVAVRKAMGEGRVRISVADPALRARIREQLRSITKKPTDAGGIKISAPRRKTGPTGGTTHGDLVSAGVLALWRAGAGRAQVAEGGRRGVACGDSRWRGVVATRGGPRGVRRSDLGTDGAVDGVPDDAR